MMKKFLSTLLLMAGLVCLQQGTAQSKLSIDNIASIYLRDSGPIISKEEVKGYFFLYQSDKIDKKTNEYTLQILDDNLNKIKSIQFNDSRYISLLESSFNGSDIMFLFLDADKNLLDYRIYGVDGEQKFSYERKLNKRTEHFIKMNPLYKTEEIRNKNLFAIENRGFITTMTLLEGMHSSFEVTFYQTSSKRQWTYQPGNNGRGATAGFLGATDNVALFNVIKVQSVYTNKLQFSILGLDLETGEKVFEYETDRDKYFFTPMNVATLPNSNDFMLMGLYFDKQDMIFDKTLGLGVWVMNEQGKKTVTRYNAWDGDISQHLKTNRKGQFEDIGDLYLHSILYTEDGKIFAIGEGFKMARNGSVKVTDMVLFRFDRQFNIESVTIYDKEDYKLPRTITPSFSSSFLASAMIASLNGFDYSFLQTDKIHSSFSFGYTDREKSKDYKGLTYNTVSWYNNNLGSDKLNLKTDASDLKVLPAKLGSVLIIEYFKKEKRLDMRLEKVN